MTPKPQSKLFHLEINPDTCLELNLSADNPDLKFINDSEKLGLYVKQRIRQEHRLYAIGGYGENRKVYQQFKHFDTASGHRCIHLGIDFWAGEGTPVFTPCDGRVHSFNYNDHPGDYGATIILEHQQEGNTFYSLYGHVALSDLKSLKPGMEFKAGEVLCHLGSEEENGAWPPHLHFQLILDMEGHKGDYPGVALANESAIYLKNCPDPSSFFYES